MPKSKVGPTTFCGQPAAWPQWASNYPLTPFDIVSEHDGHRYTVTIRSHVGNFTDWNKNTEDYIEIQKAYLAPDHQVGAYAR